MYYYYFLIFVAKIYRPSHQNGALRPVILRYSKYFSDIRKVISLRVKNLAKMSKLYLGLSHGSLLKYLLAARHADSVFPIDYWPY